MNINTQSISAICAVVNIGLITIFATHVALAIERSPDNAKEPVEFENRVAAADEIAAKLPFIGCVTASVPEMVADEMNLKHGVGVIVNSVTPKSPADLAGIKPDDIILKLNANDVNDPVAFNAGIRSLKIGDKIQLNVIQKGKPADLEVTLVETPADVIAEIQKPKPLDEEQNIQRFEINLGGVIDGGLNGALGEDGIEEKADPNLLENGKPNIQPGEIKGEVLRAEGRIQIEVGNNIQRHVSSSIRMMDEQGSIELKTTGESKEVTVCDEANKKVWSGPWDTEQDKAAAPDGIRARVEKLSFANPVP